MSALPAIVTVLPVTPVAGVMDVIRGTFETAAAVAGEAAGAPVPEALRRSPATRIVEPTYVGGDRVRRTRGSVIAVHA